MCVCVCVYVCVCVCVFMCVCVCVCVWNRCSYFPVAGGSFAPRASLSLTVHRFHTLRLHVHLIFDLAWI